MENKKQSPAFIKRRKFLTVVPVLVFPFITLAFWALGGGSGEETTTAEAPKGFKLELPGAHLKDDKTLDKMGYYDQAGSDSAKMNELKKNDPYYQFQQQGDSSLVFAPLEDTATGLEDTVIRHKGFTGAKSAYRGLPQDPNEQKIYQKLDRLNAALAKQAQAAPDVQQENGNPYPQQETAAPNSEDVARLEQMMHSMNQPAAGQDPELQQMDGILEKLMDIQHPDRVKDKMKQASEQKKGRVFAVATTKEQDPVSSLDKQNSHPDTSGEQPAAVNQQNGFYSFDNVAVEADGQNAIEAVVHESQTLTNGATVKLRLTNDVYINGVLIPKGNFVFGTAGLNGERLTVKINSIRYHNNLFPVELAVFDMDGLDGIYIPGAIPREVAKESADQGLQNIGLNTLDPSIGMQAATVGIAATKSLLSKKVKLIRVTVKAGYQVLLRDEKQKQQNQ